MFNVSERRSAVHTIHALTPLECGDLNMRFDSERCSMQLYCVPWFPFRNASYYRIPESKRPQAIHHRDKGRGNH